MKRLMMAFALAVMSVAASEFSMGTTLAQGVPCVVTTVSGDVQGVNAGASCAFLGIPFAAPPTGNLRWKRPAPLEAWAPAVLNATVAPPNCPQLNTATGLPIGAEDCLKLNVWTPNPSPASGAPVIVW